MWIRQGVTTFREFWARSAHFGQNWGYDESAEPEFFVSVSTWPIGNFATADFHQIWLRNVFRCPVAESGKTFSKIFTLGVICPQNLKWKVGQTGTSLRAFYSNNAQSRLQITGCTAERYCLLHVVVQGPGSFWDWSTFLYDVRLRSYLASNLPTFRILAYFPRTKPLKRTFRWPAYSPGVTSHNNSDFHRAMLFKRGLCCHAVSVRLSIRQSVCHVRGSRQNE